MATYNDIANSEIDPESPLTSSLFNRLRDNPLAMFEGAAGAPKLETAGIGAGVVTHQKLNNNTRVWTGDRDSGSLLINGTILINWRSISNLPAGGSQTLNWETQFAFGVNLCIAGKNFQGAAHNPNGAAIEVVQVSNSQVTIHHPGSGTALYGQVFALGI